ncbi:MAG: hypothetical protein MZV63_64610 [Marinilabiliales bacterium]|nr:hypothetical protein [Marinilabiliales bacterium]
MRFAPADRNNRPWAEAAVRRTRIPVMLKISFFIVLTFTPISDRDGIGGTDHVVLGVERQDAVSIARPRLEERVVIDPGGCDCRGVDFPHGRRVTARDRSIDHIAGDRERGGIADGDRELPVLPLDDPGLFDHSLGREAQEEAARALRDGHVQRAIRGSRGRDPDGADPWRSRRALGIGGGDRPGSCST